MIRRNFITLSAGIGIAGLSGCLGDDGVGSSNGSGIDPAELEVDIDFQVEGSDLVVYHNSGDVLPAGETVYVTISGDAQNETQLQNDIHAGGEIIRVEGADNDFEGKATVAVYVESNGESFELETGEIRFSAPPAVTFGIDYDEDSQTVFVRHEGGESVDRENLAIAGDIDDAPMNIPGNGSISVGDSFEIEVGGLESGDKIQIVWESDNGEQSAVILTHEIP